MLLTLLRGRLVFTPDFAENACDYVGEGDLSDLPGLFGPLIIGERRSPSPLHPGRP